MVIGGGNAALVAALAADDEGARVLIIERAPRHLRGGNTRHTRNIRCVHTYSDGFSTGMYPFDELWSDGHVLARLYEADAARVGQERGFHAIAVDARAPKFDGGIATRLDTIPFGIVVDKYGHGVAKGRSVGEVATQLELDPVTVNDTVRTYNDSIVEGGTFRPGVLDDCHTVALVPPKTHWAQRLDRPPCFGVAMRPGITFTYRGVAVGPDARVVRTDGSAFENAFAAGEIMSGNILSTGYLGGFGMTIGSVWGRLAGVHAAA